MFHWDATKVKDWDTIDPALKNVIDPMLMSVGIGTITEDNVEEFFYRVHLMEHATGAFRNAMDTETEKVQPYFLFPDEARSLIGYSTNVGPMTTAKFKTHIFNIHRRMVKF